MTTANSSDMSRTDASPKRIGSTLEEDGCDVSYRSTADHFRQLNLADTFDSGVCESLRDELSLTSCSSVDPSDIRSEVVQGTATAMQSSRCTSLAFDSGTCEDMDSRSQLHSLQTPHGRSEIPPETNDLNPTPVVADKPSEQIVPLSSLQLQLYEALFCQDEDGDTKLHLAIIQPDIRAAMYMIAATAPCVPTPLNIQNDRFRQTPLHLAVLTNQPLLVRLLVICGAVIDLRDRNGNTPLHLACSRGQFDCIKAMTMPVSAVEQSQLVGYCHSEALPAFYPPPFHAPDLGCLDYEGRSYIHLVQMLSLPSRLQIIDYLVNCGADLNIQDGKSGHTVLHLAVKQRDAQLIDYLCGTGKLNINLSNYNRHTALDMACCLKFPDVVQQLSRYGATSSESFLQDESRGVDSSDDDTDDAMDEYDDLVIRGQRLAINSH